MPRSNALDPSAPIPRTRRRGFSAVNRAQGPNRRRMHSESRPLGLLMTERRTRHAYEHDHELESAFSPSFLAYDNQDVLGYVLI